MALEGNSPCDSSVPSIVFVLALTFAVAGFSPATRRHFTDVLSGPTRKVPFLHDPAEVGTDPAYALRTATGKYRTTPLRGLWQHPPYFHDGSAATLADVVSHYNQARNLKLDAQQQHDLVEYLKTL